MLAKKTNMRVVTADFDGAARRRRVELRSILGAMLVQERDVVREARDCRWHRPRDALPDGLARRHQAAADGRGVGGAAVRVAHLRARQVEHRHLHRRDADAGDRRRADEPRRRRQRRDHEGAGAGAVADGIGRRVGRVLPVPRRPRRGRRGRRDRGRAARRIGRDAEVIAAADEHGLAMVFTGRGISGTRAAASAEPRHRSRDPAARRPVTRWGLLLALAAVFHRAGRHRIWDANEAFYAETPREMLQAHDLLNPSFNYLPRFNKPVLSYWIVAALYKCSACRWASNASGSPSARWSSWVRLLLARLATSAAADRGWVERADRAEHQPALWAAAGWRHPRAGHVLPAHLHRHLGGGVPLAHVDILRHGRALSRAAPDVAGAHVRLARARRPDQRAGGDRAAGLAFALYLIVTRVSRRIGMMILPLGVVIVALIVVPWYAALYHEHGWS